MNPEEAKKKYHDFWFGLIQKAFDKSSFDTLCTLLRPRSMHDAGWDVLDECRKRKRRDFRPAFGLRILMQMFKLA
ncbi:MAG TPA: hypothetical protein VE344_03940 [Methylomirabilota bacterium]|nr:hypothetical protein [Methylomirabilota bacterium]